MYKRTLVSHELTGTAAIIMQLEKLLRVLHLKCYTFSFLGCISYSFISLFILIVMVLKGIVSQQ